MKTDRSKIFIRRPRRGWFDLNLGEVWAYRDLMALFVRRDFVAQYKQSILGPAWFVVQPLLQTLVFTLVFGRMAGFSTDGLPRAVFYLSGTILWTFFSTCLTQSSDAFITHANLFSKVYFPRMAVPVSIILSQMMRMILQLVLFLAVTAWYVFHGFHWQPQAVGLALAPAVLIMMACLAMGWGMLFSALTIRYRDLRFLLQFGVQLMMYLTPVIFPLTSARGHLRWILLVNPMTPIIETFRYGLLGTSSFSWGHLGYGVAASVLALLGGMVMFSRTERTFTDIV